uniref:AP complex mu/sigma subunit domain-containing protein n=1 Tax=Capra hircus TaxID=9925 RepID=A0A8C2NLV5_CAPHI
TVKLFLYQNSCLNQHKFFLFLNRVIPNFYVHHNLIVLQRNGNSEKELPRIRVEISNSEPGNPVIHFILLFSRQGKLRLQKWYTTLPDKERKKITREIVQIILSRGQRTSSFVDWKELKLVYKRYASLYFCCAVENQDNELLTLEIVHRYVELLDKYFGNFTSQDSGCWFLLMRFLSVLDSWSTPALNSGVPQLLLL